LLDHRTLRVLFTTLVFVGVLALVYAARRMLLVFLFAIFFAYLLEPLVDALEPRMRGSRGRAVAVTYLVLGVILAAGIAVAVPRLEQEGQRAAATLPSLVEQVGTGKIAWQLGGQHGWSWTTSAELERFIAGHRQDLVGAVQGAGARAAEVGANAGWLILVPILALFLLKDKADFGAAALSLVDDDQQRTFVRRILDDLDRMLAQYIRAQLTLALFATIAYTTFLLVVRFPYALVLGVTAGILEFIPVVGPAITAVALALIGFLSGYNHWLLVLVFVGVWRLIQDYVNTPYLMGEGLELHPLAAVFGILVGGEVAGIPGMFLSIPILAGLRIVWVHWRQHGGRLDAAPPPVAAPRHSRIVAR
jgi:predicted PurR-regulated permease PerM